MSEWRIGNLPKLKKLPKKQRKEKRSKQKSFAEIRSELKKKVKSDSRDLPHQKIKRSSVANEYVTGSNATRWQGIIQAVKDRDVITKVDKWVTVKKGKEGKWTEGYTEEKKKVNVQPHWRDPYENKKIVQNSDNTLSEAIEIDHVVPSDRFNEAEKLNKKSYGYLPNLVVTSKKINQAKSNKGLGEFTPSHNPKGYARKYESVLKNFDMVMKHGEARAYKKITGQDTILSSQHVLDHIKEEPIHMTQRRHDMYQNLKAKQQNNR